MNRTHFQRGPLLIGLTLLLVGCNPAPRVPGDIVPIRDAGLMSHGHERTWRAAFDRIDRDLPWAAQKLGWAVLKTQVNGQPDAVVTRALLPDGRTALIIARPEDDQRITVAVQVGHFGDAVLEKKYLAQLTVLTKGPPRRERNKNFQLPEPAPLPASDSAG